MNYKVQSFTKEKRKVPFVHKDSDAEYETTENTDSL